MKPETRYIGRVHRCLPAELYIEKMANPYRGGTADCWYSGSRDLWVEYKYLPKLPARGTTTIDFGFSPLQKKWLNGRHAEGRAVAGIVGCPTGGVLLLDGEWNDLMTTCQYSNRVVTNNELANWIVSETNANPTDDGYNTKGCSSKPETAGAYGDRI